MDDYIKILNTKEDLSDELKPYLTTVGSFEALRHPLVFCVPYFPQMNALMNKQFKHKKELLEKHLSEKEFGSYIFLHERPYRFDAFKKVEQNLSDKDYWELLSDIWTDSENIWQNLNEWKKLLKQRKETKHLFMSEADKEVFNSLPDKITIYRGCIPKQNEKGLSYTIDKEKAEWFSKRFHKNGKVIKKVVDKSEIFAYTNSRNEKEVILL